MKTIKLSPFAIYRNFDEITVLYNIKHKNYIIINDIGRDIWNFIVAQFNETSFSSIVEYVAQEYNITSSEVEDDIACFIESLLLNNMVCVDDHTQTSSLSNNETVALSDIEGEIIQILRNKHQIYSATFELTYACNERCVHCYATPCAPTQSDTFLSANKCKQLIDELYQMKCLHLSFTGGDPFVFDGFLEVLDYARQKHFSFDIYTNGQILSSNPNLVERIAKLYPRTIYISLYGATAETHDSITRIPNSHLNTIKAIKMLKQAGISVVLNVMLMKPNHHEAQEIIELANQLGVDYRIGISIIRRNNGDDTPMNYFIDDDATISSILRITNGNIISMDATPAKIPSGLLCGAGTTSLSISPNGDVYPCVSLKRKLGSIISESLTEIWSNPSNIDYVYSLVWENTKKCTDCEYLEYCPHCIGISEAECGDIFECNHCDKTIARSLYQLFHTPLL